MPKSDWKTCPNPQRLNSESGIAEKYELTGKVEPNQISANPSEPILAKEEQSWHRLNNQWLTHRSRRSDRANLRLLMAPPATLAGSRSAGTRSHLSYFRSFLF